MSTPADNSSDPQAEQLSAATAGGSAAAPPGGEASAADQPAGGPAENQGSAGGGGNGSAAGGDKAADRHDEIYRVQLEMFEGPLDLLLHLIRKHELDILDIPVSFITQKYLEYLDLMRAIQIDPASEYLLMAATLAHIKSRMLLPNEPGDSDDGSAEEEDPRTELVRRLLEYQKYKHAAEQLGQRDTLGRDVFGRGSAEAIETGPAPLAPVNVFRLFDAFEKVLERADQVADHEVLMERLSISERIVELTELLHQRRRLRFDELFESADGEAQQPTRMELVVTFLALLEMCRSHVAQVTQHEPLGPLIVEIYSKHLAGEPQRRGASSPDGGDGRADPPVGPSAAAADAAAPAHGSPPTEHRAADGASAVGASADGASADGASADGASADGASADGSSSGPSIDPEAS